VPGHSEAGCGGHLFDELLDGSFLSGVRDNIDRSSTRYAHKMVMVSGKPLGQLESPDAFGVMLGGEHAG
jgi:hypothetical protein